MVGDGGFAVNQTELWTAVQERAELVVMVMNDRGYGVIKHIQGAFQDGRMFFGDLLGPDFGKLAAVAGLPAFRVGAASELGRDGGAGGGDAGAVAGGGGHGGDRRLPALCALQHHGHLRAQGGRRVAVSRPRRGAGRR